MINMAINNYIKIAKQITSTSTDERIIVSLSMILDEIEKEVNKIAESNK